MTAGATVSGLVGLVGFGALVVYVCRREWRRPSRLRSRLRLLILVGLVGAAVDAVVDIPKAVGVGDVGWMLVEVGWLVCPFVFWVRWSSDLRWRRLLFVESDRVVAGAVDDEVPRWS